MIVFLQLFSNNWFPIFDDVVKQGQLAAYPSNVSLGNTTFYEL